MSFEEIEKLPEKYKSKTNIIKTVWYVKSIRKMMTKTWWIMVFLYCESFYYDFEVSIFPKDYSKYKDELKEWKIIIVSGRLNINTDYKRKWLLARDIKFLSLPSARKQAKSLWLFDDKKYNSFIKNNLIWNKDVLKEMFQNQENDENQNEDFIEVKEDNESEYNEDINENETKIEKYVINIPSNARKEDLIKLKNFMNCYQRIKFIKNLLMR